MQCKEILPNDTGARWHTWTTSLPLLADIDIPRWMGTSNGHDTQIHVFCDASERAYGAVLYIQSPTCEGVIVRQACSKNRLAPVKKITLPRLKLLAALVGVKLLEYFCRETDLDFRDATLWIDTTVVLSWICSNPSRWKTFVCNRVTEIDIYDAHTVETLPSRRQPCRPPV
jgi:hypothetical protein